MCIKGVDTRDNAPRIIIYSPSLEKKLARALNETSTTAVHLRTSERRTGCEEALSSLFFLYHSLPFSFSLPLPTAAILYFDVSAENSDYEVSSADGKARSSFAQREEKREDAAAFARARAAIRVTSDQRRRTRAA